MDENNKQKKVFPKKTLAIIISCVLILSAAAVTVLILLNRETPVLPNDSELKETESAQNQNKTEADTSEIEPIDDLPDVNSLKVEIIPTLNTSAGIEVDTEFLVKTGINYKVGELLNCLAVKSGESYSLSESEKNGEYIMTLDAPLKYESIYRIEFTEGDNRPVSFAFQTVEGFKVTGTTPGNNAYSVPVNTGIEINFNEKIDGGANEFENYFTISPYVNGKFENVGNAYIFIPDGLKANTRYEITVRAGLKGADHGRTMNEDYNFCFWTQWEDAADSVSISNNAYETFLSDDEVFVELHATGVFLNKSYHVEIYELANSDEYLNAEKLMKNNSEVFSSRTCIDSIETELFKVGNEEYSYSYVYSYVMLNKKLPNGWYLIKITTEHENKKYELYKFIQVSPLSVYSVSIDGEMLFWVNDTSAGNPASGAVITTPQGEKNTDSDGVATIDIPSNKNKMPVTIKYNNYPEFIYETTAYKPAVIGTGNRYYHYVYTDRRAYRPTDTIDVFGVIRERYADYKITASDKVTLKIGNMLEIPVTLDNYGSFNVKIPITDMKGYLSIELCLNGVSIEWNSVNIVDYDNSKYAIDAVTDKWVYRPGEMVEVIISVETYDGTSAEGVEIMQRFGEILGTTDENGKAKLTEYAEKDYWSNNWSPHTRSIYYDVGKTENKIQYISVPYVFMPSDIMLEHEIISESEIAFKSNYIVREAIEKYVGESWYNAYYMPPDLYRGAPVNLNFAADIHKYEVVRTKTGEKYDYINKVNMPVYSYSYEDNIISSNNYTALNGEISIKNLPVSDDPYISYYIVIGYADTEGNKVTFNIWYGGNRWWYGYNQSSIKNYYFNLYNNKNENIYKLRANETGYIKLGEYNNRYEQISVTEGKILTVMCHAKNKIISTNIGSPNGTPVTFTEDGIYNVQVTGAYFNGKYIYPIYGTWIYYDYSEKTLDFDVSFDKESYAPGDEVTARIKVSDEKGEPKKTLVNISVVDESVFAEYENQADMPPRFYSSVSAYFNIEFYVSYTQHEFLNGGGAEMGDGGGDDYMVRKDFTDNPAFVSIETDDLGIATVKFKLAEKITSWRVTVHGITSDNYVGNAKKNIISSMPFAIDIVMNNEYINGDDITIIVKPQGAEYKFNKTEVMYAVQILNGETVIKSGDETNKGLFDFNAGKLPEGNYIVRVTASMSAYGVKYGDGMEKAFSVIKSGVLLPITAKERISEEQPNLRKFDIKTSPVKVTMSNYDMSFIMQTLYSCVSYSSQRTDYIAANVFGRKFTESIYNKTPLNISQSDYLGVKLGWYANKSELLYGDTDLLYAARFHACFPETAFLYDGMVNDENQFREYIYSSCLLYNDNIKGLNNMTPAFGTEFLELNRAAGYLTLAAINDPVLLEIYEQVNIIYNSKNQEKFIESYHSYMRVLYYAAALCALGDDNKAAELMEKYQISEILYNRADEQATQDMWREYINTLTLYINTRLDPDAAYKYLREKQTNKYVSDVCEKINFVRYFTFKGGTRSEIEYNLDGETKKEIFVNYDVTELVLTKEQFEALNIKQISGNTAINLSFYGSPENLNADKNKISLKKQILSRAEFLEKFKEGEYSETNANESAYYIILKFKLPDEAPRGYYKICDRLPGNMRFINSGIMMQRYENGENYFVSNPEKQFVNIYAYVHGGEEVTVVYNAVRISEADAVTEKAYISMDFDLDDIWGVSE